MGRNLDPDQYRKLAAWWKGIARNYDEAIVFRLQQRKLVRVHYSYDRFLEDQKLLAMRKSRALSLVRKYTGKAERRTHIYSHYPPWESPPGRLI